MNATAPSDHGHHAPIRLLHVDDDPALTELTAAYLTREDDRFEIETATSVDEGLDLLAQSTFDCIVSDYDMPGQNGIEFLEAVREGHPDLPFILFTGKGSEEVASDAITAGVSDYLQKGGGSERYSLLANRIRNLVTQHRAEGQLETRARQQRRVAELGREALAGAPLETLFDRAVEVVTDTLDTEYAKILEYRPEREDLLLRAGVGWHDGLVGSATVGTDEDSQAGHTLRSEHPIVVEDLRTEDRFCGPPLLVDHDVVSGLSIIIGTPGDPWGVLGAHSTDRTAFNHDDITFVQNVAHVLANAIERVERETELGRKERRYQAVFNDPNILVGLLDTDGTVLDINRTAMEYVDVPLEEITGTPLWETPWFEHSSAVQNDVREWIADAASGEYVEFEADLVRPNGETYTVEGVFRPVTNEDGEVVSLLISDRDVTEQKQRKRELETMTRRLEAILDNTTTPMFMKDDEGRYLFVNRGYRELFDLDEAKVVGRTDREIHPPEIAETVWENDRTVLDTGAALEIEERVTVNGEERVFLSTKVPIYDTGDRSDPETPVAILGIASDITDIKARERELKRERERFQAIFEKAFDAMLIANDDGEYVDVNQSATELLGLPEDELLGKSITDFAPDGFDFQAAWQQFQESDTERGTFTIVRADGTERIVEYAATTNVVPGRHLSVLRDVTDQKRIERRLKEEQQFVQSIFDALPDPLYTFDTEGNPIRWNDRFEDVTGYDGDEIGEMYVTEFVPDDEADEIAANFQRVLETEERITVESAFETRSGARIPYEFTGGPLIDADDTLWGVTGIGRDLTTRKKHERRLTALTEIARDLMGADTRQQVAEVGVEAAAEVLNLDANAIHLFDDERSALVPAAGTDAVFDLIDSLPTFTRGDSIAWRAYERQEAIAVDNVHDDPDIYNPDTPVKSELHLPLGKHGILIAGSNTAEAFDQQDLAFGKILAGSITAALEQVVQTEQLRAREQELARQNQRLEQFASVVSHDLRNPLQVAEGRLELAREACDSEHLDDVGRAHERMAVLIDDLLTLAREGEEVGAFEPVDLEELVESCWQSVGTANATLDSDIDLTVRADRSRLRQIIENLIRNSIEHGGDDVTITVGALPNGVYVEDSGPGIPEDERDDVFAAGYSTSEDGTGFGLSIVNQVVNAHGWDITVTTGSDGGARFEITNVEVLDE